MRDGHYKTELTGEINDKLKTVTHTPKDKWGVPQTSNQEIGWFANVINWLGSNDLTRILGLCINARGVLRRNIWRLISI